MTIPALQRALDEIDAHHDQRARLAKIVHDARVAELVRQFSADCTGLLTWLSRGLRRPIKFNSVQQAQEYLDKAEPWERALVTAGDWKANPNVLVAVRERQEVLACLAAQYLEAAE